jgi:hypothetical protein
MARDLDLVSVLRMTNNQIENDKRMTLLSKSNDSAHRSAGASCLALTAAAKSPNQQNILLVTQLRARLDQK